MKRTMFSILAVLACLAVAVTVIPARALRIAPAPIALRVANSDAIVVGKVVGYAPMKVPANRFKGDTSEYQIALVEVKDALLGKLGKEVRVGFIPPVAPPPPPKGVPIRPILPGRFGGTTLNLGQEVCLFLVKPAGKDFYTAANYFDVVNKEGNPAFVTEVAEAKKYAGLLANARANLEAKDAATRFDTAAMLLTRYRTQRKPGAKQEAIDAKESKLILQAIEKADWGPRVGGPARFGMEPQQMFFRLGLTPADGWVQPKDFRMFPDEARKWLSANAGKYVIKRFVND